MTRLIYTPQSKIDLSEIGLVRIIRVLHGAMDIDAQFAVGEPDLKA